MSKRRRKPGLVANLSDSVSFYRVATPAEAIANGADYLVIGTQVTRAAGPRAEAERVISEIGASLRANNQLRVETLARGLAARPHARRAARIGLV